MTERTSTPDGQLLLVPDVDINMFWTNLGDSDEDIIALYHAHGECEQFHSEIKTDMGVERLPSGKFDTNELVLELTVLAYNILRMIGQEAVRQGTVFSHSRDSSASLEFHGFRKMDLDILARICHVLDCTSEDNIEYSPR